MRRHLREVLVGVMYGPEHAALRLARQEVHRLIGAVLAGLHAHPLNPDGKCRTCDSPECALRPGIRLALMAPQRLADGDGKAAIGNSGAS